MTENKRFNTGSDALKTPETPIPASVFGGLGNNPTAEDYNTAGNELGLSSGQMQYQHGNWLLGSPEGKAALAGLSASGKIPTMEEFNQAGNAFGITRNVMRALWMDYNVQQSLVHQKLQDYSL